MNEILEQPELNRTFFVQIAIFWAVLLVLDRMYFRPFLKLFQARQEKTTHSRELAEKLMAEANQKLESYQKRLQEERALAKKEFEVVIEEGKKQEAQALAHAREEAKKITQEAADSVTSQKDALRSRLEADVEAFAEVISQKLLSKKN